MGEGILRRDMRLDRHPCVYRVRPHQIKGGCGCFCHLCTLPEPQLNLSQCTCRYNDFCTADEHVDLRGFESDF